MKKRLLSAFLALAMVLTLLPATAFATTYTIGDANPDDITYVPKVGDPPVAFCRQNDNGTWTTVSVTYQAVADSTTGKEYGKWYWQDNKNAPSGTQIFYAVTDGIVVGTGNSGQWYPDVDALTKSTTDSQGTTSTSLSSTSFILLGPASISSTVLDDNNPRCPTSLTIDVNGYALSLDGANGKLPDKLSSLTINNRKNPLTIGGSVSGLTKDIESQPAVSGHTYSALRLTVNNTQVTGGISLTGGANNVTLNNVRVTGGITMNGHTVRKTADSSRVTSEVWSGQTLNVNTGENETRLSTSTSATGETTITGDNSRVVLNNFVYGTPVDTTITGNGGSLEVDGLSSLADINVSNRDGENTQVPTVTITSGQVGTITRVAPGAPAVDSKNANQVTVKAGGKASNIITANGKVVVDQGKIDGSVTVDAGSVDVKGPVNVGGQLQLGAVSTTTLSITGNGSQIGGIATTKGANLNITQWPAGRGNYFGTLTLGSYDGKKVSGGVFAGTNTCFADSSAANWFSSDLQLVVNTTDIAAGGLPAGGAGKVSLYGKTEMARAISDVTSASGTAITTPTTVKMRILCQGETETLKLRNGNIDWAHISYDRPTGMILPTEINGFSISKWISGDNSASVPSGSEQIIPLPTTNHEFTLLANDVSPTVAKAITKAAVAPSTPVENQNVRVTLNGNTIQLSGAVVPDPGSSIATIQLTLTTDALVQGTADAPADGTYVTLDNVQVFYNVDTKAVGFNRLQSPGGGAIVNDAGELVLNNGTGAHYTVSASLSVPASRLGLYTAGKEIQATLSGKLASRSQTEKDRIITSIAGGTAEFDINGNRAVLEAINAAQATITANNSVDNWVKSARDYIWKNGNSYKDAKGQDNGKGKGNGTIPGHTGSYAATGQFQSDRTFISTNYAKAWLVPYLVVNATDLDQNGVLTANLTVYYRIDVSGEAYSETEYYTVQAGRPLGTLNGDMSTPVLVKFNNIATGDYMHQDGKYVYAKNGGKWAIDHAGSANGSLGAIVINSTDGPITLTTTIANRSPALNGTKYDNLQAAIDDTVPGYSNASGAALAPTEYMDSVNIGGTYAETNCVVTMTGAARKILVKSIGNRKITSNTKDVDVQTAGGYNYTIELKKDNVASGTVAITVTPSGNGTASANRTIAKVGESVTVTTVPSAGLTVTSITAKTNTGAAVSVTSTGVANQYKFTVPNNATSVTVTPVFGTATAANLTVTTTSNGLAVPSATQVYAGQQVTITTRPNTGYRATGVTVSTNSGTVTATRTAENTYTFTVPANATYVTVTPTFAADTGLPFADVPANDFYLDAVKFVYNNGLMNGITATTFGGSRTITRGQIVTILYRLSGSPTASSYSSFQDVPAGEYYAPAITWAASNAIVNGRNSTTFAPNDAITRQELAAILYRYTSFRGLTNNKLTSLSGYTDQGQVDDYASIPMQWCVGNGIINGTSNTTLTPRGTAQRYQAAIMLMRYCQSFLGM